MTTESRLLLIEQDLSEIKQDLQIIKDQLAILISSSHKMDSHIDFINSAYSAVRKPLNYLKTSFDRLTNQESIALPDPSDSESKNGMSYSLA